MRIHEPGGQNCPSMYGIDVDCKGKGIYAADPYAAEIHEDYEPVWLCDGQRYQRAMDI